MSDDIVGWLRAEAKYCREECLTPDEETAGKLEEAADEIERLRAERNRHIDYEIDLQRIIEDLCHDRDIREPKTTARHHYDMAVKRRQK